MSERNSGSDMLKGIGLGAALMYFMDPDRGRRRRALMRDRVAHLLHGAADALGKAGRDLGNRSAGLVAEARSHMQSDDADDEVIAARVRAELGRVVSHPSAVLVRAERGHVTLAGAVLSHEVDALLDRVSGVRGVTSVEHGLDVHERPGNVPELQGGVPREGGRFELLQENWTPAARLLVGVLGGAMAAAGTRRRDPLGAAFGAVGLALFARAATNMPMRRMAGATGRRAVDVRKTINIDAPVDRVFTYLSEWEHWPRFMTHVREVRRLGHGLTHWVVDGPAGVAVEWDAVVTELMPNQVIAWKSVEGSTVEHAGVLKFVPGDQGGTRVDVQMTYSPPAGVAGHAVAVLFGRDPKRQMDDDLVRLKTTIETGTPPRDAAAPGGAGTTGAVSAGPDGVLEQPL